MISLTDTNFEYVPIWEQAYLTAMLDAILEDSSVTISLWDTEEYSVENSRNVQDITNNMGAAEEDRLYVNKDGEVIGGFYLIYNNGSEGDPEIVVCDCDANEYCDSILNKAKECLKGAGIVRASDWDGVIKGDNGRESIDTPKRQLFRDSMEGQVFKDIQNNLSSLSLQLVARGHVIMPGQWQGQLESLGEVVDKLDDIQEQYEKAYNAKEQA